MPKLPGPGHSKRAPSTRWWSWEDMLLILLLAGVLYLPGLGRIPLFDRDEPRFAVAAREMITQHNFIVPHFNGVLRPDKPPLIYWLMVIGYKIFGVTGLAARLPSALFAALTLLVVYGMAGRRFGRAAGVLSALMLSVSALYFAEARLATADATMVFFTTVAMACAWNAWDAVPPGERRAESPPGRASIWTTLIFWCAIAAGILTKGVTPIFVFATMLALSLATGAWSEAWRQWRTLPWLKRLAAAPGLAWKPVRHGHWRWWRTLHPAWGLPLLLALLAPWFMAAWWQTHGQLIEQMLRQNLVERTTSGLQHHGAPPGFYLGVIWGIFWPWSVLLVPAGFHVVRHVRQKTALRVDPAPYQFLLAWIIPSWIIFELFVTKMVEYVLPLFIPLAILCAVTVVHSWGRLTDVLAPRWFAAARWVWMGVWLVLAGIMLGAAWRLFGAHQPLTFLVIAPTAVAVAGVGVAGAVCWNRHAWPYVTVLTFGLALLIADTVTLPNIPALQLSRRAAAAMRLWADKGFHLAAAGYIEPSLVFYCGRRIKLYSGAPQLLQAVPFKSDVPSAAGGTSPRLASPFCVLVDQSALDYLKQHHRRYYSLGAFTGLQLAKGRPIHLTLITNVRG